MTWIEFKTAVRTYLTVDGNRLNIQDYIDRAILSTVIDLQSYIPYYRIHSALTYSLNGTIKDSEPLADDEHASTGALEGDVRITDAYFIDGDKDYDWQDDLSVPADINDDCRRVPMTTWSWANRFDLMCGLAACHNAISIHPNGINFIVFPQVTSTDKVEIFYQSIDRSFADSDVVPFSNEEIIMAVAENVKSKLAREVDRDLQLYSSYAASYAKQRQRIYLDARDRKRVLYQSPSPLSDAAAKRKLNTTVTDSTTTITSNCS